MAKKRAVLTHLDPDGRPAMVDVSAKAVTARAAQAECRVKFPPAIAAQLRDNGLKSAKGGIVDTAIIAGTMAVNVMGHNLVIAKESDMAGIAADGMAVAPEHVKPDDARVIAHTRMIGGGESASVTFDVARIKDTSPLKFFCSFPGHLSLMQGSLAVQ